MLKRSFSRVAAAVASADIFFTAQHTGIGPQLTSSTQSTPSPQLIKAVANSSDSETAGRALAEHLQSAHRRTSVVDLKVTLKPIFGNEDAVELLCFTARQLVQSGDATLAAALLDATLTPSDGAEASRTLLQVAAATGDKPRMASAVESARQGLESKSLSAARVFGPLAQCASANDRELVLDATERAMESSATDDVNYVDADDFTAVMEYAVTRGGNPGDALRLWRNCRVDMTRCQFSSTARNAHVIGASSDGYVLPPLELRRIDATPGMKATLAAKVAVLRSQRLRPSVARARHDYAEELLTFWSGLPETSAVEGAALFAELVAVKRAAKQSAIPTMESMAAFLDSRDPSSAVGITRTESVAAVGAAGSILDNLWALDHQQPLLRRLAGQLLTLATTNLGKYTLEQDESTVVAEMLGAVAGSGALCLDRDLLKQVAEAFQKSFGLGPREFTVMCNAMQANYRGDEWKSGLLAVEDLASQLGMEVDQALRSRMLGGGAAGVVTDPVRGRSGGSLQEKDAEELLDAFLGEAN